MKSQAFIHDNFLLMSRTARRLYHDYAKAQPIFDYHCHLSPKDIAENRRFNNLFEIWLEGDHYKWRAMRSNGIPEHFITGGATPEEKFKAWASTVPHTIRNPLYHWTHLELSRYFGITDLLNEGTAGRIWDQANEALTSPELSTHGILRQFRVTTLCTTDDPTDNLLFHDSILSQDLSTSVLPTFRPDSALAVDRADFFKSWVTRLGESSGLAVDGVDNLFRALTIRCDRFHEMGCRLSDHGLEFCCAEECSPAEAQEIFDSAMSGKSASPVDHIKFASHVMLFLGRLYSERKWTMQLHLGAIRNNNSRLMRQLGPDTGFDSIGDFPQVRSLATYLNRLDSDNKLPKTILYNLNPADNYAFATMLGNFQDGTIAGKIQLGSGWWFLDQKEAMEWQLNSLSNLGLLSRFVGMVTDSRSFMSYPRHEYFRRTLCNLIGREVEEGIIPDEDEILEPLIKNICWGNASRYMDFPQSSSGHMI
jgi:glucuronate isomerase